MKSEQTRMIEILESRIAPARVIIAGIPNSLGVEDTDLNEAPFVNTEDNPLDPISNPVTGVGPGIVGADDTFYLRLSKGDKLQLFRTSAGASVEDFITVQSGNIVVFFIDRADGNGIRDNELSEAEVVGIAAGKGAKFELKAALAGDIVYNLNEQGTSNLADDALIMNGAMTPGINIPGFTVGSSVGATILNAGIPERVGGKVLASGNISNVVISGDVGAILAGSAGNAETFNFFPNYIGAGGLIVDTPGGDGLFNFTPAAGKVGSSIQSTIVNSITDRIEAGVGGEGAAGGSIKKIFVRSDFDGFELSAGKGGTTSPTKKNGGKGGSIDNVTVAGAVDFSANDLVQFNAGAGGDSTDLGSGGAGGSVSNIFVGYTLLNGKRLLSNGILRDNVLIASGEGGNGKTGGKGGAISTIDILTSTPEGPGDEISVIAGNGGDSVTAASGKAGIGGSIQKSVVRNVEASIGADIGLRAGDGGASLGLGVGAGGGSVSGVSILGRQIQIDAGDGSDGKVGGKGGGLTKLTIEQRDGVVADAIVFNAGIGGDGNVGNAGKGGDISAITVINSDVNVLEFNSGIKGNGGDSVNGRGGAGGNVKGVAILDTDANGVRGLNLMTIRSGAGGDGDKGGGNGGAMSSFSIVGLNIEPTIIGGDGGRSTLLGKGGAGGGITNLEVAISGQVTKIVGGVRLPVDASTRVTAGAGGDGAGISGSGGIGGTIATASVNTPGFGIIEAGQGGSGFGARAAAGRGGSVLLAGVFAGEGEGRLIAGDAGAVGSRPGAGGNVAGTSAKLNGLFAFGSLTIQAGDGTAGGAGGSISNLGYGSTENDLVPTPRGNILVQAGNGSASLDGKSVGKGGSITNVGGAVNSTSGDTTIIRAGDGGGSDKKAAAGGSITNLLLQRGGGPDVVFTIRAGDGGDAPLGSSGAKGGSVAGVSINDVSNEAILRHIAAGDGGNALKKGGAGGSVSKVNILDHDIGVRDGELYGFDTMGGVFAGAGGTGAKEGVNGSVTIVNADMIATIAAGRGPTPKLVTKVDNIYLNDSNLLKDSTGAFLPSLPGSQQVFEFGGFSLSSIETTPGDTFTGEVQSIDLAKVRALPIGTEFTLTFQGEETVSLSKDATEAEIAAALNALATVQATGIGNSGTVTVTGANPVFDVTFIQTGNQTGLITGNVDAQRTTPLPLTATATEVEAALDALTFVIAAGGVTVTPSAPSGYQIVFGNPGDQSQIIGQEVFDVNADDIQAGVGNTPILVTETLFGLNEVHSFIPIAPFKFNISYNEGAGPETTKQILASATADEVRLELEALPSIDPGEITVTKRVSPTAPDGMFEVKFEDVLNHTTLQVTMFADQLAVTEAAPGALENITKETQVIRVDPMGDGVITFAFSGDSFALNLGTGFTLNQLSDQLNLQPSVIARGGAVVTLLAPNVYQVVFGKGGDQPNISVQEDAFPLGYAHVINEGTLAPNSNEVVLFTHEAGTPLRFGYEGSASATITPGLGAAGSAAIDAAIESLPGIAAAGGVTVTSTDDNSYRITFNQPGDRTALNVGQDINAQFRGVATTIQLGIGGAAAVPEIQLIRTTDTGFFSLSYNNIVSGYELAGADVVRVQAMLDFVLAGLNVSGIVSLGTLPNSYQVEFSPSGPQIQLHVEGLDVVQTVDEIIKGANTLEQQEVQVVKYDGAGEFALHVPVALTAEEFRKGGDFTFEQQVLGLSAIQALPGAQFTLSYQGQATLPLPSNATDVQIEAALNTLTTIQNVGLVDVQAQVDTQAQLNGRFDINFITNGDKFAEITGNVRGGVSTGLLPGTATPLEIENALNALLPIIGVLGVKVEQPNVGSFNIIFNEPGQMPEISAYYQVLNIQQLDFYNTGDFTISFAGDTTQSLPAGSTPLEVQTALNALPSIQDAGQVVVTNGLNSRYEIQFNNAGFQPPLDGNQTIDLNNSTVTEGTITVPEVQKIVKTRRYVFTPFDVLNQNLSTIRDGNFVGAFSDASEIDARVFKWDDANGNGLYELNEVPFDGLVAAKVYNQSTVNFTAEARYVGGSFSFVESVKGSAVDFEVQLLTIKADKYTLVFDGHQTVPISGKASILAIQSALNALASIQATGPGGQNGSVTVTADVTPNTYAVTFNTPGADRNPIRAPFFYDYNNIF